MNSKSQVLQYIIDNLPDNAPLKLITEAIVRDVLSFMANQESLASETRFTHSSYPAYTVVSQFLTALLEEEWDATAIRNALQTLLQGNRLNKSAILGADFALNFQAKYDMSQYASLTTNFPNVQKGDFWIADGIGGEFGVQNGDWVIALLNDATFENEYQSDEWMILSFSSTGGGGTMTASQIRDALQTLIGANMLDSQYIGYGGVGLDGIVEELDANKADKTEVIVKNNTTAFTPTSNYHPATKKYVDDSVSNAGGGDMMKSVYDPTDNGFVDKAGGLRNGLGVVTWANIQTMFDSVSTELASKALASALTAHINRVIDAHLSHDIEHSGEYNTDQSVEYILDLLQDNVSSIWENVAQNDDNIQSVNARVTDIEDSLPSIERISSLRSKVNGQAYSPEYAIEGDEDILINFDNGNMQRVTIQSPTLNVSTVSAINGASYVLVFYANQNTEITFNAEFVDLSPITLNEGEEIIVSGIRTNNHFLMKSSDVFNSSGFNPPILSSILINDGDEATASQSVIVTLSRSGGNTPTHYLISENAAFSGASWAAYVSDTISTSLSSGGGSKTIYVKLKDSSNAESTIRNASIIYVPTAPVIGSVTLRDRTSNSIETTDELTVNVEVALSTSGLLLEIRTSESQTFADNPAWASWNGSSMITHTIADTDPNESKTVYVQVRNIASVSPSQNSGSINYVPVAAPSITSFSLDNGASETTDRTVTLNYVATGSPNQYMASENESFSGASWINISGTPEFVLSAGNGTKTVYFKVRRTSDQLASDYEEDSITLAVPAPTITVVLLDGGSSTTSDEVVILGIAATGSPDQYMASEDDEFTGLEWLPISDPMYFTLSPGDEEKTVYVKVKRLSDGMESTVGDQQITLAIATPVLSITDIDDHGDQTIDLSLADSAGTARTMKIIDVSHEASAPSEGDWTSAPSLTFATSHNHTPEDTGQRDVYVRVFNYSGEYDTEMDTIEVSEPASSDIDLSQYVCDGTPTLPAGWPSYAEGFCFVAGSEDSLFIIDDAGTAPNYGVIKKFNIASNTIASDFSATMVGFTKPFSITHKTGNTYFILDKRTTGELWPFEVVEIEILPSTTGQTITKSNGIITTINPVSFQSQTNNCDDLDYDAANNRFIFPMSRYGKYPLVYDRSTEAISKYAPLLADDWFINNVPLSASGNTDYYISGLKHDSVSGNLLIVVNSDNMANTNVFIAEFDGTQILPGKLVENTDFTESDKIIDVEIKADRSKIYLLTKIHGVMTFTKTS